MRKTKLSAAIISVLTAVSLCGCANVDGEAPKAPANAVSQQTSEMISSLTDGSLDELLSGDETSGAVGDSSAFPTKCKIYKQTRKQFSEELLVSLFSGTPQKIDTGFDHYIRYETDTEEGFISNGNSLNYFTPAGSRYNSICTNGFLELNGLEDEVGTLDFSTRDEVLDKAKALMMDKFDIPQEDLFARAFYAVKKDTVDFYKQSVNDEANKPVTSSNELELAKWEERAKALEKIPSEDYYYISFGLNIDGKPFYSGGGFYFGQDESAMVLGYRAEMVYTKNGVESLSVYNLYETDTENAEEADIISIDEAKALIRQKFDSIIMDEEPEIYDMKLVYLPIPQNDLGEIHVNFESRPFYAFYYTKNENFDGEIITSRYISYFDAVTGNELSDEPISD